MKRALSGLVVAFSIAQVGCYKWEAVRPTEVPKLSGSFETPVLQTANVRFIGRRVVDVERPDGTLVQIAGKYDLRLTLKDGREIPFEFPIAAERQGDELVVRGSNLPGTRIPLATVSKAEASQFDGGTTTLVILGASAVVAGIAIAAITASQMK